MFITLLVLLILIVYLACYYYVHYGPNGRLIHKIPGPPSYPIIGNILLGLGSSDDRWKILIKLADQYYPVVKMWGFSTFVVTIRHPDDLKIILSSTKQIEKSIIYDLLHPWLSTGLLTSGGSKWQSRRKILTPTFHFNILQQFVEILIEESENMTSSLQNAGGSITKDLVPFLSEHTLNAISETAMGTSLQGMNSSQQQYRKAVYWIGELFVYRLLRQWLYSDWIFSLTPKGREQAMILKILHGFTEKIIAERKVYHKYTNEQYLRNLNKDTVTDAETIGIRKKRLALLDLLISLSQEGLLTDADIREEVDTFIFGNRVRKEVDAIMQENQGKLTMRSLQELQYLERCIKEALRLYPSVSFISRVTSEEIQLKSYLIPARTTLLLNIYGVHRDPNFWPNPEIFDPDRFLSENIRNRHPYSYIPFSAGPRNCIGQRFAFLEMKAMIAPLIHNFYLEPVDYLKDLRIGADLLLRPIHPHRIKFIPISTKCM